MPQRADLVKSGDDNWPFVRDPLWKVIIRVENIEGAKRVV
jgi:hypothetical protein